MTQIDTTRATPSTRRAHRPHSGWDAPTRVRITLTAASIFVLLVGANLITPLFPLFSARLGLTTSDVTLAFVAYIVPLVVGLPIVGHWSDHYGRRAVMAVAVVVALLGTAAFVTAQSLGALVLGRALHGAAVALATGTAAASLRDLLRERSELATALTLLSSAGGVAAGPFIGGLLSQFGDPMHTPYLVHGAAVVVLLGLLIAVKPLPPVAPPPADHPRWLTLMPAMPRVSATTRRIFTLAAATGFLSFAVFGYFLAIAPGRYADLLGGSRLMAGMLATIALGSSAAAQLAPIRGAHKAAAALTLMTGGLALAFFADHAHTAPALVVAGFLIGGGQGVAFRTLFATMSALTPPREVARSVSLMYVVTYCGSAIPVLVLGMAIDHFGADTPVGVYFVATIVMAALLALACLRYRVPARDEFAHHGH